MSSYRFSVLVARDMNGWEAYCPDFPDCRARGRNYEEAVANLREAIRVFVEDGFGDDEPVPQAEETFFATLSLAISE
jgi:predicted RNase H-like HicB family nuclease